MHRCLTHVVRRFIPTHVGNTPHLRGGRTGRAFLAVLSLIDKTPGAKPEWKFKKAGHGQSIHAPARGATAKTTPAESDATVSIHAPTRGATNPHAT